MPGTAVYICDCMGLVSKYVDTEALQELATGLDDVVLVKRVGLICGKKELAAWAAELRQQKVDKLLFAGCSPRMSLKLPEKLLQDIAQQGGLDPCLVETANIREQCAWIHRDDRQGASAKARDMLRMAHSRLQHADPGAPTVSLQRRVLVVGAGPAGLAAAEHLALAGVEVILVEKNEYVGGKLCQIGKFFQNESWPAGCEARCIGPVQAHEALTNPLVDIRTTAEVESLTKTEGNFRVLIKQAPMYVDPDRCISCGECEEVCPEETPNAFEMGLKTRKAISRAATRSVPESHFILAQACTFCGDCVPVCPTKAINLEAKPRVSEEQVGAVILATGTEQGAPEALLSSSENVVTALQFERMMENEVVRPSDGKEPEHIVFVQCAGSRGGMKQEGEGVPYCSRTCCSVTAKQVKRLSLLAPMAETSVLYYRDFRTYERALEKLYVDLDALGVEFHNGEVTDIEEGEDGDLTIKYLRLGTGELEEEGAEGSLDCGLTVLACAQQSALPQVFSGGIGMPLDAFGFPIENQPRILRPTETFVDRVYTVGAALGPKAIQPSVEQGTTAALKAIQALSSGEKQPLKHASSVDQGRCGKCGVCVSVCPHGAAQMTGEGAYVDPAFCQGCGFCGASCPSHAASLLNFSDQRLLSEVGAAFDEAPEGEPRILALLCYWCSSGGVDLAGTEDLSLPTCVRTMRIRCSCSVNLGLVMEMFRMGIDGVYVSGCPENSCHHMWGNFLSFKRTAMMQSLLQQMGLDERRFKFEVVGVPHAQKFIDDMEKLRQTLRSLGANPWGRGEGSIARGGKASWLAR